MLDDRISMSPEKGNVSRNREPVPSGTAFLAALIIVSLLISASLFSTTASAASADRTNTSSAPTRSTGAPLTTDYPRYGEDVVNASGEDSFALQPGLYGNITVTGNATVKVLGSIEVNGVIRISGTGTLDSRAAEVVINPPPIGRDENVIRVWESGTILIQKGSTFTVNPQPVTKIERMDRNNASFIEVDDDGRIIVQDSIFTAKLPGDVVPEDTRVTGGTILITGQGSFICERSSLNAYLNFTEYHDATINSTYVIMERWFFMSSQRYGLIRIENSTCTLHEPGQTIFKPTNGQIIIRNSTVYGNVRPETISKFHIADSVIHSVNDQIGYATIHEAIELNDNAVGIVERTILYGYVKLGWSSTNEFLGKADPEVRFIDCTFETDRFECFANTTVTLTRCRFANESLVFEISDRSRLHLISTDLDLLVIECGMHQKLVAITEDIRIAMDGSRISMLQSMERDVVFNLDLRNGSSIDLFRVHFDQSYQNKTVKAVISSGSLIHFENASSADVEVVLRNSDPPTGIRNENFTTLKRYVVSGIVTLNGEPIPDVPVSVLAEEVIDTTFTDSRGIYSIDYDTDVDVGEEASLRLPDTLKLTALHLGLNYTTEFISRSDNLLDVPLIDLEPPTISNITWSPGSFNHKKYIVVDAVIIDNGTGVVSDVLIQYRINGRSWTNQTMFNIGGDRYETVLPRFDIGDRVEIRITASDSQGNKRTSNIEQFRISRELINGGFIAATLLLVVMLIAVIVSLIVSSKRRIYLGRRFKGSEIPDAFSHLDKERNQTGTAGGGR
ncbi:MAG: hypothetical protein ACMUIG_05495 [Thermoplasmatota archaeon]